MDNTTQLRKELLRIYDTPISKLKNTEFRLCCELLNRAQDECCQIAFTDGFISCLQFFSETKLMRNKLEIRFKK